MDTENDRAQLSVPVRERRSPPDPLTIILERRRAAGCEPPFAPERSGQGGDDVERLQYLGVIVAGVSCGIRIAEIREIIRARPVTEVPGAPPFLPGVISLRGTIIPVLNTALRLGLPPFPARGGRLVVITAPTGPVALLVDRVSRVVPLTLASGGAEALAPGIGGECVAGIGRNGEQTFLLLDVERVADISPQ